MSSSNLTLRLLRAMDSKLDEFRRDTTARFDALELRVMKVEQTVNGFGVHLFMVTDFLKK